MITFGLLPRKLHKNRPVCRNSCSSLPTRHESGFLPRFAITACRLSRLRNECVPAYSKDINRAMKKPSTPPIST